jgi:hypothetical protein
MLRQLLVTETDFRGNQQPYLEITSVLLCMFSVLIIRRGTECVEDSGVQHRPVRPPFTCASEVRGAGLSVSLAP